MQIKLGEKIRELRHRDGRTQEVLADALGVSSQAVSRWEANGGYPDMEIIPAIANYFHITIDELFGYNGEREEKIHKILDEADEMINAQGDMEPCITMLRRAVSEFPSEAQILLRLGYALLLYGYQNHGARMRFTNDGMGYTANDIEYNGKNHYFIEALEVLQKALSLGLSHEDRSAVIPLIVRHYAIMGKYSEAEEIAKKQDSVIISFECLLVDAAEGEKGERYQGEALLALTRQLRKVMETIVWMKTSLYMNEIGVQKLLGIAHLYELIFDDGNCGKYHADLANIYKTCAVFEAKAGNIEAAMRYYDIAFNHAIKYEQLKTYTFNYTASLVSKVVPPRTKFPIAPANLLVSLVKAAPENLIEEIRKNDKYKKCFTNN
jgi:transcriptional regulator with XRE-family HTH domain